MTPTAEQLKILEAAKTTRDNLLVVARAGAAKTTTLVMLLNDGAPTGSLCIAFNKKIQLELAERIPASMQAKTMNALGHKALWKYLRKNLKLVDSKLFDLLKAAADTLVGEEAKHINEEFSATLKLIRDAKNDGYLPQGVSSSARSVISQSDWLESIEEIPTPLQLELIDAVLAQSFNMAVRDGIIDFSDQIYLPAIIPSVSFDTPPLTLVDEAQDLSDLNHILLKKIVKNQRVIAVGDPCQAIYGFRGASDKSMPMLREKFDMQELYLTLCFRSAENIVKEAHWRAPDMQWRPGAPEGSVTFLPTWSADLLQPGDAIICRNNAPLFGLALKLMQAGLYPELASGDIVKGLLALMKKLGKPKDSTDSARANLEDLFEGLKKKNKNAGRLADQKECIRIFLDAADTLGEAMAKLEEVTSRTGTVKLMTGHKSKGLEFNRVFFLDQHLLSKEGQDPNIRYVIITRARNELYYIKSEDYVEAA